jgi:hypothetical protein
MEESKVVVRSSLSPHLICSPRLAQTDSVTGRGDSHSSSLPPAPPSNPPIVKMARVGRLTLYGFISTSLFLWTVLNAFRQRSNFYAAAVYLSKSNACVMVRPSLVLPPLEPMRRRVRSLCSPLLQILWNQVIYQTVLLGKVMQAVFLGELRLIEVEVRPVLQVS